MSRVDQLSESGFEATLKQLETDLEELKNAQRFGSHNVVTHRIFSSAPHDIDVSNVQFDNRIVEVAFTPDDTTDPALGGVFRFEYTSVSSGGSSVTVFVERLTPINGVSKWRLYLNGSDFSPVSSYKLKFYFFSNSDGTFTAQLV